MSLQIVWDDDAHTILRWDFIGHWTWDDLAASIQQGEQMMDSVDHPVASLIDMTRSSLIPSDVFTRGTRTIDLDPHRNFSRIVVFVTTNAFLRAIQTALSRISNRAAKNEFHFVASLTEGRAKVRELLAARYPEPQP